MDREKWHLPEPDLTTVNRSIAARIRAFMQRGANYTQSALAYRNLFPDLHLDIEELETGARLREKTLGTTIHKILDNDRDILLSLDSIHTYNLGLDPRLVKFYQQFSLPLYTLHLGDQQNSMLLDSPYGKIPNVVIDSSNCVYYFRNTYGFDESGNALKLEHWNQINRDNSPVEFCTEELNLQVKQIFTLPVILPEEGGRTVTLTLNDYSFVSKILTLAEGGMFT